MRDDQNEDLISEHATTVMRSMPIAVTRCSADLRYLWASRRYADWVGLPPADIIGHRIEDVLGKEGLHSIRPYIDVVLSGKPVEYEEQVVSKRLGTRWIHAEYSPTFDASGKANGWVAAVVDITDRKRLEERLASNYAALSKLHDLTVRLTSEDTLQTLLDAIVEAAIILTGADKGTLRLHDRATHSLRIVAQSGFEAPFLDYFAVVRDGEDVCGQALEQGQRMVIEDVSESPIYKGRPALAVLGAAGARAVQATVLVAHDGRRLGVLATHWSKPHLPDETTLQLLDLLAREAADLIEHRRREDGLREANRSKDEFLAMLGHELRNPLAPIATAVQILRARGDGHYARTLDIVERQVHYLTRLVDDLLDVSRITRGTIRIKRTLLRIQDVVAEGAEMAMPLIEQRQHRLDVHLPKSDLRMYGDSGRLAQVIANLLTNAAKYTQPNGQITLEASLDGSEVVLRVSDNGVGISSELLPHVFDMFTQERQDADRARGGLGLGLTIVRNLVEMHGGTVSAESAGRGRGSTFVVRLPAAVGEPVAIAPPTTAASVGGMSASRRILVVDDNEDALDLLADVLRTSGHSVETASDAPKALDALKRFHAEIAILDIGLPVVDGYELARRIRTQLGSAAPRLIALTGYGQDSDRARAWEAGFAEHLTKPIDVGRLLKSLDEPHVGENGHGAPGPGR